MVDKTVSNKTTSMVSKKEVEESGLFQPQIFKKVELRHGFKKETIWYPFVCSKVFMSKEDAAIYLPFFIKELIKNGDLQESVLKKENGKKYVDEEQIKTCIVRLQISAIEQEN